jgi:DNA-directed RNA polymerase subunit RPC12/RpoP
MSFWKNLFRGRSKPKPNPHDKDTNEAVDILKRMCDEGRLQQSQKILDEMHGGIPFRGSQRQSAPCDECGDRVRGMTPFYKCPKCSTEVTFSLSDVQQYSQLYVRCPKCKSSVHIPQSVLCKKCGRGLTLGWQEKLVRDATF